MIYSKDISFTFSFYFLLSIFISLFNILLYFFISAIFIQFFSLMLIDLFFYCSFNIFIIFLHYSSIPWIFLVTFYFLVMLKDLIEIPFKTAALRQRDIGIIIQYNKEKI